MLSSAAAIVFDTLKVELSASRSVPERLLLIGVDWPRRNVKGSGGRPAEATAS